MRAIQKARKERQRLQRKRRLNKCVAYLQRGRYIQTTEDIAKALGVQPATVRGALSEASHFLSENFLQKFITEYSDYIRGEWLLEGSGRMTQPRTLTQGKRPKERWERVAFALKQEGLSVADFSEALGLNSTSTVYRILRDKAYPRDETILRIQHAFPYYNADWLLDGKGDPIDEEYRERYLARMKEPSAQPVHLSESMQVPLVPDRAAAGHLTGYGELTPVDMDLITIPIDQEYKGNYFIFEVVGASMDDGSSEALIDGDKLLCREVYQKYWRDGLHTRTWPYFVFVTREEGIIVKKVKEQDLKRDLIICQSLNPEYPDITLHLREIFGIYNVIQIIGRLLKC